MKYILRLLYCTIIGGFVLFLINIIGDLVYFHIPFNLVNSIITGLLGIPGIALIFVLKVLFSN